MHTRTHRTHHRLVGNLADHLVHKLDGLSQRGLVPHEQFGAVKSLQGTLQRALGQRSDLAEGGELRPRAERRHRLNQSPFLLR